MVDVITFKRQYPESLFPGSTQLERSERPSAPPAKRLVDTMNPITWIQTARAIRRSQPDILLLKYWMPFFAPAFGSIVRWASSGRTRVVVVVDNALPHEPHIGDRALSRYFLKAAHRLVVMSNDVRRDLETLGVTGSVTMVPHPVYDIFGDPVDGPIARERLGIGTERLVLLFFGFVRRYKGLHVLLEAMPEISPAFRRLY
jgi:glycosyltransferase involved in cell wall biosynthesis